MNKKNKDSDSLTIIFALKVKSIFLLENQTYTKTCYILHLFLFIFYFIPFFLIPQ